MPKCNFNKITLRQGCSSVNLLNIIRTAFPKDTSGRLLLLLLIFLQSMYSYCKECNVIHHINSLTS